MAWCGVQDAGAEAMGNTLKENEVGGLGGVGVLHSPLACRLAEVR